ncbi:MAG: hypothetical protein U0670_11365 [Anaerolineae bacterium]
MIWLHRFQQGLRALAVMAFAPTIDDSQAALYLTPQQLADFRRLKPAEQMHSLRVLSAVLAQADPTPSALAAAALMHDVGKTRYPVSLFGKTLPVLVSVVSPTLVTRLSQGDPRRWWVRPFATYRLHPQWSGDILTASHANPDAVWLAAHHADPAEEWHDHPLYPLLVRLQQADDVN